ncbi:uncharacterized protein At3g49140 isoform X2 [Sesamum indicum]|uniref:Uncharacterized protein At3g49140 isoform X2 n=1 Tax=Sesamum indicum TaxID=4182 RepID=A0A6I9TGH0_SESIN|nr:uncharacterized protein At3g49140 isoform X2 [Sesamum indicum]
MLMLEPQSAAVWFSAANFDTSVRTISHSAAFFVPPSNCRRCGGRVMSRDGIRAAAKEQNWSSGWVKQNAMPQRYHPLEEIAESELLENGDARLTPAETTRTIIEVNSKATLFFSGLVNEDIYDNIFWPDLPYVTDEHGNIYFRVKNDGDILQNLATDETIVQVIIGLDNAEMISQMEALGHSEIDFGIEELENEDSYDDEDEEDADDGEEEDNYEKDWVAILDEEDQDEEFDGTLGDWAKLDTMRSSHPMYFAQKLVEVVSDAPLDYMDQRSTGLAVQGLLRPAFVEEHSVIQKHASDTESSDINTNHVAGKQIQGILRINGHEKEKELAQGNVSRAEELEKDETLGNGYVFYELEMIKIQLISSHGDQGFLEIEDFRRAQPDAIAHSAAKIISRLKAGGEKITRALKSLCWRCKGIQVEECVLIGVDSLGFDLRVCSGRQVQTLRFAFKKRASSEYSAERQLNDLLFPKVHKFQQVKEPQQTEF